MKNLSVAFVLIFLVWIGVYNPVLSQNKKIDSLKNQLSKLSAKDTNQMNTLIELGRVLSKQDLNEAFEFAQKAEKLAKELKNLKGEASALQIMGVIENVRGNYVAAIDFMRKSLEINKKLDSKKGITACLNNLGSYYTKQGDYVVVP